MAIDVKRNAAPKLEGKIALVTGASSGIGAEIARRFASEGADIIVNFRSSTEGAEGTAKAIRELGRRVSVERFDVGDSTQVTEAFDRIREQWGRIDILVNNAGLSPKRPFLDYSEDQWDRVFATNIKSVFLCTRLAVPMMPRGGAILNISSIHAVISTYNFSVYAATKGAMESLTRSLACELAERGIRINAIRPGWVRVERAVVKPDSEAHRKLVERIPIARTGKVDDIAPTAVLLCCDDTSYVTGQIWAIDGGHATMMNAAYPKGHVDGGAVSDG